MTDLPVEKSDNAVSPGLSLNQRIRSDIEAKILSGEWMPGHRIPFEHELMAEYGCARMTVNKVLSGLAVGGLIERRRRAGSFVRRPHAQSAVLEIPDIKAVILRRGQAYGYELLSRRQRKANAEDRVALSVTAGTEVLMLRCRHLANKKPFAIEERRINLGTVPDAAHADLGAEPPGTWLLHHVPWTEAENRISAAGADAAAAELLGIAPGAACLVVDRQTWRSGQSITRVRMTYPGDLYDLVARFTPSTA